MNANVTMLRPQGLESPAATIETTEQQIETFLGAPLPPDFKVGDASVELMNSNQIDGRIRERPPYRIVEKCVGLRHRVDDEIKCTVIGVCTFTAEMCAGHFPGKPSIPFIDMAKLAAQVGAIAAALQCEDPTRAPVGVGSGGSRAQAKDLIPAPATLLVIATVKTARMSLNVFDTTVVYLDGKPVGKIEGMMMFERPSPEIRFT